MRMFRRPRDKFDDPATTEFMWGVPRREGHSDTDDPSAHSGLMQHAFEFGKDDRAICGAESPKRTSRAYRDARPQLAVPGRGNPKCRKCELLVGSRVRADEAVPVMDPDARNGRPIDPVESDLETSTEEVVFVKDSASVRDVETAWDSGAADEKLERAAPVEQTASDEQGDSAVALGESERGAKGEQATEVEQAASYEPVSDVNEAPDQSDAIDLDSLSRARDPGFHPRGQMERGRRRSVRRGGTIVVGPGRRSVLIEVPISTEIAGIVANVEPETDDVRVEAVTVGNDGTARVTLSRPAPAAVQVAWYIVSNPFRDSA